jgi:flagellar biosynthesis/type III secretory pathway protein FliH
MALARRVAPLRLPTTVEVAPPEWLAGVPRLAVRMLFGDDQADAPRTPVAPAGPDPAEVKRQIEEALARAEAEGLARGEAAGRARIEEAGRRLEQVLADLVDGRARIVASAMEQVVELASTIAEAILEREIALEEGYLVRLGHQALELLTEGDEVTLSVAPSDRGHLEARLAEITRDEARPRRVHVRADEAIASGCLVETHLSRIDATLRTRVQNVAESLRRVVLGDAPSGRTP